MENQFLATVPNHISYLNESNLLRCAGDDSAYTCLLHTPSHQLTHTAAHHASKAQCVFLVLVDFGKKSSVAARRKKKKEEENEALKKFVSVCKPIRKFIARLYYAFTLFKNRNMSRLEVREKEGVRKREERDRGEDLKNTKIKKHRTKVLVLFFACLLKEYFFDE